MVIDVLGMEYAALRSDIIHRSSARLSILPIALSVFALLGALAQALGSDIPAMAVWTISLIFLTISAWVWIDMGRSIGRVSSRLVEIEQEINRLMNYTDKPPLRMEIDEQRRRGAIEQLILGNRPAG